MEPHTTRNDTHHAQCAQCYWLATLRHLHRSAISVAWEPRVVKAVAESVRRLATILLLHVRLSLPNVLISKNNFETLVLQNILLHLYGRNESICHVKWVPNHHGMARPRSREQPTRGGPPAWELSVGLTTPSKK
jgi:hypothetical protein